MKKIFTLCVFALTLFLGTQSVTAQNNTIRINAEASQKTEALRKHIKFDNNQRDQVYEALKAYTKAKMSLESATNTDKESMIKLEKDLEDKMKAILSEEQFDRYKSFSEEQ